MEEIWKDVVGYEGFYEVSNLGRIRTVRRVVAAPLGRVSRVVEPIIRKQQISTRGYRQLSLCTHGKTKTETVHRLVAEAFIPKQSGKDQVNHIDGDKDNNKVSNLEWCDAHENTVHAYELGLRVPRGLRVNPDKRYNYEETRARILEMISQGMKQYEVAEALGIHRSTVGKYVKGRIIP